MAITKWSIASGRSGRAARPAVHRPAVLCCLQNQAAGSRCGREPTAGDTVRPPGGDRTAYSCAPGGKTAASARQPDIARAADDLHRDLISCGLIARGWVMSWGLLLPERSCGLLGLITLPGGRPTSDGALTPGVVGVERSRTTTPERRGPILTAPTRQPRLQPWPCLCRCEYLRQCTASVRSSASAACRIPAGALMVIELAGDVVRKITRPTLAVIVSKSGRMSSSRNHPLLQR